MKCKEEEEEKEENKNKKTNKEKENVSVLNFDVSMSRACHALILFGKSPKERHLVQKDSNLYRSKKKKKKKKKKRSAQEESRLSFSLWRTVVCNQNPSASWLVAVGKPWSAV